MTDCYLSDTGGTLRDSPARINDAPQGTHAPQATAGSLRTILPAQRCPDDIVHSHAYTQARAALGTSSPATEVQTKRRRMESSPVNIPGMSQGERRRHRKSFHVLIGR